MIVKEFWEKIGWGLKRWVIPVLMPVIVLTIIAVSIILFSKATCVDSNGQCKGQHDGAHCELGKWCDSFGRVCGGTGCAESGDGKCFQGKCMIPEEYLQSANVASVEDCKRREEDWYCYYWLAQKLSNPAVCDEIEDEGSRDWCIIQSGGVKTAGDCEKMKYRAPSCYFDLAQKLNDPSLCDKIEGYRKIDCITQLAKSIKYCDKVKDEYQRNSCINQLATSIEDCNKIKNGYPRDNCLNELAKKLNDSNICSEIENEDTKGWCILFTKDIESVEDCEKMKSSQSWCYSNLAKKLKDFNICEKIEADVFREPCISELARSIEDCNKIIKSEYLKKECMAKFPTSIEDCEKVGGWECYNNLAQKLKNPEICYNIQTPSLRENCTSQITVSLTSIEDCNKIEQKKSQEECLARFVTSVEECEKMEYSKSTCYYNLAQKLKDMELCYKIEKDELYNNCAIELIKSLTSIEECEKMDEWEAQCYSHLARKLNNPNICGKINWNEVKELCMIPFIIEPDECETLKQTYPQSICYYEFAKKLREDTKFCEKIRDENQYDNCKEYASDNWKAWEGSYEVPSFEFYILPGNPTLY